MGMMLRIVDNKSKLNREAKRNVHFYLNSFRKLSMEKQMLNEEFRDFLFM